MSDSEEGEAFDLFQEPKDFYPPEKEPSKVQHKTSKGDVLELNLVGHNPLWVSCTDCLQTMIWTSDV